MSRSLKKVPVEPRLLDRVIAMNEAGDKKVIKTWSRSSTIFPRWLVTPSLQMTRPTPDDALNHGWLQAGRVSPPSARTTSTGAETWKLKQSLATQCASRPQGTHRTDQIRGKNVIAAQETSASPTVLLLMSPWREPEPSDHTISTNQNLVKARSLIRTAAS